MERSNQRFQQPNRAGQDSQCNRSCGAPAVRS